MCVRAHLLGNPAFLQAILGEPGICTPDRALDVIVEHYDYLRLIGKYTLNYRPADLHWSDIATAAPGIKPGETRSLYRDRSGHLGDKP